MNEANKERLWALGALINGLVAIAGYLYLAQWFILIAIPLFFFAIMFGVRAEC